MVFLNPFKLGLQSKKLYHYDKDLFREGNKFSPDPNWMKSINEEEMEEKFDAVDDKILEDVYKNVKIKIKYHMSQLKENDHNFDENKILKKYIWLKELVKWNVDPESSKIKFKYFLK